MTWVAGEWLRDGETWNYRAAHRRSFFNVAPAAVSSRTAPPPVLDETVPEAPGSDAVWIAGHWRFDGRELGWEPGRWQRGRSAEEWLPARWVARYGAWRFVPGTWAPKDGGSDGAVFFFADSAPSSNASPRR